MSKSFLFGLAFWVLNLYPIISCCQVTIGSPDIYNYYPKNTKAGAQTWNINQDRFGNMYFANNSGLLTYNGKAWKLFKLPNKTIVRSLLLDNDDKIYVGGQDAIGYFFPDKYGSLEYHSLVDLIPIGNRSFGDVWSVMKYENDIFFETAFKIFRFQTSVNKVTVFEAPQNSKWSFLGVSDNRLIAQNGKQNIVHFKNDRFQPIDAEALRATLLTDICSFGKDSSLISTLEAGVFLFSRNILTRFIIDPQIVRNQIFCIRRIGDNNFAVGTVSGGIYFIDKKGNTTLHYSTENGMQNNNVLCMFVDGHSNLWVGLDEGIDLINYVSPITKINPVKNASQPTYTAHLFRNNLYLGTSDGLYVTNLTVAESQDISLSKGIFKRVAKSNRQVWGLFDNGRQLLMGHHDGTFIVNPERARLLDNSYGGCWLFRTVPASKNIIAGTYDGLHMIRNDGDRFEPTSLLKDGIKETLRFIEIDSAHNIVWGSHPYRGIYKIQMTPNYERIVNVALLTKDNGLPANTNNFVFKAGDQIIFTTEKGVYEYNHVKKIFEVSKKYQPIFGDLSVKFMTEDKTGKVWFATEKGMGVIDNMVMKQIPEMDGELIAGFENIYPINDNNIFIGSNSGIIHLNYNLYRKRYKNIRIVLNSVVISSGVSDSVLYNGYFIDDHKLRDEQSSENIPIVKAAYSSVHFDFSSDQFGRSEKTEYSYKLEGFDLEWSSWSYKSEKDYTNLPYGDYKFLVKAKDNQGNVSKPIQFSFVIKPRWYQTTLAYVVYVLLLGIIFYAANKIHVMRLMRQKKNYEKEQAYLKYVHELELEHNEREIIQLKNEKLENEVLYKNKELASTTMHLYKRGRLLGKIKQDLSEGIEKLNSKDDKVAFKKLIKLLADEEKQDLDWEQFSIHFDQVHNNFLHKIKKAYPELSSGDLKICAYLKMNLSSKEIAQLLNISLKGIEIGRYRLRKKLSLRQEVNLSNFLSEFE